MAKDYAIVENVETLEKALSELREAQKNLRLTLRNRLTRFFLPRQPLQTRREFRLPKWLLLKRVWVS